VPTHGNDGKKFYALKAPGILDPFIRWDMCSASGSNETAHSNHGVGPRASTMVLIGSSSPESDPHTVIINSYLFTSQKTLYSTVSKLIITSVTYIGHVSLLYTSTGGHTIMA